VANALEDGDPYRESVQSKRWVGVAVGDLLDIDVTEKAGKAKVSSIVKTWLKTGVLAVERVTDARQGREVAVVVQGDWISHDEV
jgi:hypothetical protein